MLRPIRSYKFYLNANSMELKLRMLQEEPQSKDAESG